MALPVVGSLSDCASYFDTVQPYFAQLQPLPGVIFESIQNPAALKQIYLDTNPLVSALTFAIATAPIFLVVSEINRNYSQVDRVWSILPTIFNLHYAVYAYLEGLSLKRVLTVTAVSTFWSVRLTYNYYRRGGYSIGSEDYRWEIVKKTVGSALFFLFNVTFISLAQPILLFLITTPTYIMLLAGRLVTLSKDVPAWEIGDSIATFVMLSCVVTTYIADQQQWEFQTAKYKYRDTAKVPAGYEQEDLERGFRTTGLWAYSRHPNFAAEQSFWVTLYLWGCQVSGTWYNWTGIGALSYLLLFQSSTWLTELLSAGKYPEYKQYQRQIGKFVPIPWSGAASFGPQQTVSNGDAKSGKDAVHARERYDLR